MTRKVIITTSLILLILALGAASVAAQLVSGPPEADAYAYQTYPDTNYNNNYLWVRGDTVGCTQTQISYLRWNVANLSSAVNYAGIILNANFTSGSPSTTQVVMYKTTDGWDPTTLTFNNKPALGDVLDQKTITTAGLVTFNAPAILTYVKQEAAGDKKVSIALAMTGNCTAGATSIRFDSAEPAAGGTAPFLDLRTDGPPPTAVQLSTASAQQNNSLPLYAGLAAVALIVVAGVTISRRRTA